MRLQSSENSLTKELSHGAWDTLPCFRTDTASDMKFFQTGVFAEIADLRVAVGNRAEQDGGPHAGQSAFRRAVERAAGATG